MTNYQLPVYNDNNLSSFPTFAFGITEKKESPLYFKEESSFCIFLEIIGCLRLLSVCQLTRQVQS